MTQARFTIIAAAIIGATLLIAALFVLGAPVTDDHPTPGQSYRLPG